MPAYEIGITEINTQVRRLGYVSALLSILSNKTLSEALLYQRVQKWSEAHESDLKNYINSQGQIRPTRMKSGVKNYTEFIISLGLVGRIAGAYRVTRFGKVLLPFLKKSENVNTFELNTAERLIYFYWLLLKDSDRLFTVINMLAEQQTHKLSILQREFQEYYLRFLDARLSTEEERVAREILSVRNSVEREWKNPKRYAENIVPPRINWLVDIGLVDIARTPARHTSLTKSGRCLLQRLPKISISNFTHVNVSWIRNNFFANVGSILTGQEGCHWRSLTDREKDEHILKLIGEAFDLLRGSPVPKVSLQPALIYASLKLAADHKIWVDTDELRTELENRAKSSGAFFDVRFSHRENESYLIAKPV